MRFVVNLSSTYTKPVIHQLRIYEIFDHNKAAFHNRFRDHAARIMKSYDFNILSMWETQREGRTEFVYLLNWPGQMKRRCAKPGKRLWRTKSGKTSSASRVHNTAIWSVRWPSTATNQLLTCVLRNGNYCVYLALYKSDIVLGNELRFQWV